ncbi:MAG: hypothetical protein JWM53_6650, partial [bacterium]|nr:hypothetical protein [bacterium]
MDVAVGVAGGAVAGADGSSLPGQNAIVNATAATNAAADPATSTRRIRDGSSPPSALRLDVDFSLPHPGVDLSPPYTGIGAVDDSSAGSAFGFCYGGRFIDGVSLDA